MVRIIQSPVGLLSLTAEGSRLVGIGLNAEGEVSTEPATGLLVEVEQQLGAYFAGRLKVFSLPLQFSGTAFQNEVWTALREIRFGATCSYAEIAEAIGRPEAVRAVGAANGQNPIPIVVPCHRVIGKDGSLTGFGGGLAMKSWLLRHETGQSRLCEPDYR